MKTSFSFFILFVKYNFQEEKRAQLEKKIEEHEIKEKEEIRRERQELFLNRKKKQAEIKIIELKMLRMKEYSAWEETQKPRKNYIMTKSKPHIHFLPRRLNDKTKELLASSKAEVESKFSYCLQLSFTHNFFEILELIEIKKQQVTEELQHIEDRIKRNFDNRISQKSDNVESTEQEVRETEEQLEDVLTESQIAVAANINNNKSDDLETKEDKCLEISVANESSDSNTVDNTGEEINSVIDNNSVEKTDEDKKDLLVSEIQNETAQSCQTINEQNNVVENTNEEMTNL